MSASSVPSQPHPPTLSSHVSLPSDYHYLSTYSRYAQVWRPASMVTADPSRRVDPLPPPPLTATVVSHRGRLAGTTAVEIAVTVVDLAF